MQDPKIDYWMFLRYVVLFIIANLGWFGVVSHHEVVELEYGGGGGGGGGIGLLFIFHSPDLVP